MGTKSCSTGRSNASQLRTTARQQRGAVKPEHEELQHGAIRRRPAVVLDAGMKSVTTMGTKSCSTGRSDASQLRPTARQQRGAVKWGKTATSA